MVFGTPSAPSARQGAAPTAPIPVAYVTNPWLYDGGGGAERVLFSLVTGLDRRLFRPFLVAVAGDGSSDYFRLAREAGVPTAVLSTTLRDGMCTAAVNFAHLVVLLRRHEIRIVHSSMDAGVGVLAGAVAGVPVRLLTTHSLHRMHGLRRKAVARVVIAHLATKNVAISEAVARNLCSTYGVDAAQVEVIVNGVEAPVASSSADEVRFEAAPPGTEPNVVIVARLVRYKGVDILLDAMARVVAREKRARLTIIGDGPERALLEQRSIELGLVDHVRFVGYQVDAGRWLHQATVFAMPSRSEGMGIAAVEALAASVPVVCSNAGGLPEVVQNDHCGIVVEGRRVGADTEVDPDDFARALLKLLTDRSLAHRLGQDGRRRYEDCFTVGKFIHRHERLYLDELDRVGGRA